MNKKTKSFKEVLSEIEDPNYQGGSWSLPENPTPLEKAKYELCEKILGYQEDNNLSDKELRQKTGLSQDKLEDILFTRIEKVNSDELINKDKSLHAQAV